MVSHALNLVTIVFPTGLEITHVPLVHPSSSMIPSHVSGESDLGHGCSGRDGSYRLRRSYLPSRHGHMTLYIQEAVDVESYITL